MHGTRDSAQPVAVCGSRTTSQHAEATCLPLHVQYAHALLPPETEMLGIRKRNETGCDVEKKKTVSRNRHHDFDGENTGSVSSDADYNFIEWRCVCCICKLLVSSFRFYAVIDIIVYWQKFFEWKRNLFMIIYRKVYTSRSGKRSVIENTARERQPQLDLERPIHPRPFVLIR